MCMLETVREFEKRIAEYYNAPFAVATDSCTHSIELCLRYLKPTHIKIPTRTYISIPFTLMKLNISWEFVDASWKEEYVLGGTRIIDGAVSFKRDSYMPNTYKCLSFQHKKMLSLGRGGAILCPNESDYAVLKAMAHDGRTDDKPWGEQDIQYIGYHYYMTPETAQLGIEKLKNVTEPTKEWSSDDYPYLPDMKVFK